MKPFTLVLVVVVTACGLDVKPPPSVAHDKLAAVASDAQIVFMGPPDSSTSTPPGEAQASDLFVMNLDGTNKKQLTHDDNLEFLPHFSPDATQVLYTKFLSGTYGTPNATTDIAVYSFATDKETLLTSTGDASQAAWSPDGKSIAFMRHASGVSSIWLMARDGKNAREVGHDSGADDDFVWGDIAWSNDDWILFVVGQRVDACFKVRMDKMKPDGTHRTKVSDGGASCTPQGFEQSGDADPGFSSDGSIIYTSRGLPKEPAGVPTVTAQQGQLVPTERKLVALSSDAWTPSKVETDLSLPSEPDCIEGVPKGSPDGERVLEFRMCFDKPAFQAGVYLAPADGSSRTFVVAGFGPDWNPLAP
jgi:hypothetical protein